MLNPKYEQELVHGRPANDLLVMDAQYTPGEFVDKVGWGHSSYAHAAHTAQLSGVCRLLHFHRDPEHNDEFLDGMLADAQTLFPETGMAMECKVLDVT